MKTRTLKNIIALIIALIVFALAATIIYVYVVDPIINDEQTTPDTPDDPGSPVDPGAIAIAHDGEIFVDGDKCYFAEGVNTFTLSHAGATVAISANPDCNFDYSVDDQIFRWGGLTDLSTVINLVVHADSFSVTIPDGETIEDLIARAHAVPSDSVELLSALPNSAPIFRILVTADDQTATLSAAYSFDIDTIDLDQSQIVF